MKTKNRFSLFTNSPNNEIIFHLRNFLFTNYDVIDFTIFCDNIVKDIDNSCAVLPSFYLTFYKGIVLFDGESNYKSKKDLLGSNHEAYIINNGRIEHVIR